MSLFGAGRRPPRERSEAERRQAMIERERRRLSDPSWTPPAGHPLAAPLSSGDAVPLPGEPLPSELDQLPPRARAPRSAGAARARGPAPTPEPPVGASPEVAAAAAGGAWPPPLEELSTVLEPQQVVPAPPPAAEPAPRQRAVPAAAAASEPMQIEPDPPAQAPAPAFDLPDHRSVAVHRRRALTGRSGARTIVSPPGDADMGGRLSLRPSRKRRAVCGVALVLGVAALWFNWQLWEPLKGGGSGEVTVEIPQGAGAQDVGQILADAGVIDSPRLFSVRTLLAGQRNALPAGNVLLKKDMSYGAVLAALSGSVVARPDLQTVTIQEGLSIRENASRLKASGIVDDYGQTAKTVFKEERAKLRKSYRVPQAVATMEGFLFPDTYQLPVGADARLLIERQFKTFEQQFSTVSMTRARRANLTKYDVLIIASMVEREARLTRERPLIAAVIYNRLKAGMPIGIDATFRYASGDWTNPIRQSELEKQGPYNSRLRTGLPPTPIGNPGLASIEAAAAPAKVDYLYYVVKPNRCGEHAFSSSAAKFEQDQARYNQARAAAGGSPVTC